MDRKRNTSKVLTVHWNLILTYWSRNQVSRWIIPSSGNPFLNPFLVDWGRTTSNGTTTGTTLSQRCTWKIQSKERGSLTLVNNSWDIERETRKTWKIDCFVDSVTLNVYNKHIYTERFTAHWYGQKYQLSLRRINSECQRQFSQDRENAPLLRSV